MRIKGLFWILTALLLSVLAIITYHAFYAESSFMFFFVEGIVILTIIYLFVFYSRIIKPLTIIGNGMDLLKEQDFSSRLSRVGQKEADRIVDIFNKMMEQLKNERLHLREQNHFLDLLINASIRRLIRCWEFLPCRISWASACRNWIHLWRRSWSRSPCTIRRQSA